MRGLDLALEQDLNVRICLLPDGHDPDSYVQTFGGDAFTKFTTDNAKDFILFKTELLLEETKGAPMRKAGLVKDIVASISKSPDPIKRSLYLKECSALLQTPAPADRRTRTPAACEGPHAPGWVAGAARRPHPRWRLAR